MNGMAIDIERVVREVLADLGYAKAEGGKDKAEVGGRKAERMVTDKKTSPQPLAPSPSLNPTTSGDLILNDRVVTMMHITGRLENIRRVIVSPESVVTPAVRDELIRRGVALTSGKKTEDQAAPVRLAMILMGTDFDPASLVAGLAREGFRVEPSSLDCIIASTKQLAAEVAAGGTLGVLLTRHTAAGVCLANRLAGVRAVSGSEASAARSIGANILVTNPKMGTFFQLKQMVTEFCRGGVRECPAVFRAQLG
jgi:hypothetical protein